MFRGWVAMEEPANEPEKEGLEKWEGNRRVFSKMLVK